jgi:hypothetical protein
MKLRHMHSPYTRTRVTVQLDTNLTGSQLQCAFQDADGYLPHQIDSHHTITSVTIVERTVMRLTNKPEPTE